MAIVWVGGGWMWLRLAGRSGRPRVRDGGHAHIKGLGTPRPLFVARPLSKVERGACRRCSGDKSRSCCARAGMLGPPRQPQPGVSCSGKGLARGGQPHASGWCGCRFERGGAGGDFPAVGGELAGDSDRNDPAGFAGVGLSSWRQLAKAGRRAVSRRDALDGACWAGGFRPRLHDRWARLRGNGRTRSTSSRRACVEPALVIDPSRRWLPLVCSDGTIPR